MKRSLTILFAVGMAGLASAQAAESEMPADHASMHHHASADKASGPSEPFIASTAKPFSALMEEAMAIMDQGMTQAPMNGNASHDFVTMMIPHHQGAVDMAKALLLYSDDPELRNLAQGIITEQENEIRLMQAWLQRHASEHAQHEQTTPHEH